MIKYYLKFNLFVTIEAELYLYIIALILPSEIYTSEMAYTG